MKLSVVIPAYNEEDAISAVIENVRQARPLILAETQVREVEIVVVNDGSRDRTAEIARGFPDVVVVDHPKNRGYGAALKTGFERASGDILGFLDGDGTCDAKDFVPLCRKLEGADLVLGTRLGKGTGMPLIRWIGNQFFAALTRILSGRAVTDIATGMRVFRREVLARLPALPDGLHYTPAQTCHALYLTRFRVAEHPISYSQRVGRSKLSVVEDGFRFLKIIVDSALVYFPLKILGTAALVFLGLGLAYGIGPVVHYADRRELDEGMIYRLLAITVFVTVGMIFLLVGVVAQKMASLSRGEDVPRSRLLRGIDSRRFQYTLFLGGSLLALGGVLLNARNLLEYVRHARIESHWSTVLVGGLLVLLGALTFALGVLTRMVDLLGARR